MKSPMAPIAECPLSAFCHRYPPIPNRPNSVSLDCLSGQPTTESTMVLTVRPPHAPRSSSIPAAGGGYHCFQLPTGVRLWVKAEVGVLHSRPLESTQDRSPREKADESMVACFPFAAERCCSGSRVGSKRLCRMRRTADPRWPRRTTDAGARQMPGKKAGFAKPRPAARRGPVATVRRAF